MNTRKALWRAIELTLRWFGIVNASYPGRAPFYNRRRLRLARGKLFDAFDSYWGEQQTLKAGFGYAWERIVDAGSINLGKVSFDGGKMSVDRLDASSPLFFKLMTDLLILASWTNG